MDDVTDRVTDPDATIVDAVDGDTSDSAPDVDGDGTSDASASGRPGRRLDRCLLYTSPSPRD